MSEKLSPLAFIITLVLFMTSILPSQASASGNLSLLWEKEFNGHFYHETATTSKNETLISTYEESRGANYVYTYDIMKLDATGNMIESKKFKNGQTKTFEYDGKGYVAFMNNATRKFELYDENFKLVSSKSVSLKDEPSFTIKDDIIALTTGYHGYSNDVQGVFYSLKTLEEINPSQIPIERYTGITKYDEATRANAYSIVGITFANTVVEDVPLNFSQLNVAEIYFSDSVSKFNGYLYAAFDMYENTTYKRSVELLKIDLQGNIVDRLKVSKDDGSLGSNDSVILNDKIIFAANQKYYEYDFASFSLTKSYTSGTDNPQMGKLSSEIYYYSVGNDKVFADYNGNEKYKVLGLDYVQDKSNEYFVGRTSWNDSLYSVATGEKVLEDPGFSLILNYDRVVADGYGYYEDYKSVVKLYGEKFKEPVEETYSPDKKWTITFSKDVNEKSVTNESIYVLDEAGKKVEGLSFKTIGKKVEVNAPAAGYKAGKTYTLEVTSAVQSAKGTSLKEEKSKVFTIK